jgi:acyl phosphate:glycerol-3-phosphate acyltransferase
MTLIASPAVAYLIGSISFAVLVSRAFGLPDPRSYGSGNPGATNVLRTGRKAAAALTLLGDALKGWFAVFLVGQHVPGDPQALALAAVAVVAGHMWPVFFRFAGGKGVATAVGVLVALDWRLATGTIATWAVILFFFRISSFGSLVAAAFAAFFAFFLHGMGLFSLEPAIAVAVIAVLLVWRHRANIRNLLAGTEGKVGASRTGSPDC